MPSDPTGVRPAGVLTRAAPDFFDDNLAVCAFEFQEISPPTGLHFQRYALFNNATTGVLFKVYAITVENDGGGGMVLFWNHGPLGTFAQNAAALRPDLPMPFGQMYSDQTDVAAGNPNPYITQPIVGQIGAGGFDSATVVSPFPLFIIPAGWSLVGTNPGSAIESGMTVWYQLANE